MSTDVVLLRIRPASRELNRGALTRCVDTKGCCWWFEDTDTIIAGVVKERGGETGRLKLLVGVA